MYSAPSTLAPHLAQQMAQNGQRIVDVTTESKDPAKGKTHLDNRPNAPLNVHNLKWNKDNAASYLEQLKKANQNVICTSKGTKVGKVTPEFLLRQGLRIPLFQRRYCWTAVQWNQLYRDATALADGRSSSHSLGRITCVETGEGLVVIDGQQRNTSCVLLLAAIRDVCLKHSLEEDADYVNGKIFNGKKGQELVAYLEGKVRMDKKCSKKKPNYKRKTLTPYSADGVEGRRRDAPWVRSHPNLLRQEQLLFGRSPALPEPVLQFLLVSTPRGEGLLCPEAPEGGQGGQETQEVGRLDPHKVPVALLPTGRRRDCEGGRDC